MILINSGAYLHAELQSEFGRLPACMIPFSNKKLIEFQVASLRQAFPESQIVVSMPASYRFSDHDTILFNNLGLYVIFSPDEFSLAEAMLYSLNVTESGNSIRVLHGDTYFPSFPQKLDVISVAQSFDDYRWEKEKDPLSNRNYAWTGFFSFSSSRNLVRCLALARKGFTDAVRLYGESQPLMLVSTDSWYDLGHLNTYFRSRSRMTTQRAFNSVHINANILTKTGQPAEKIQAESAWFQDIPTKIKRYTPQFFEQGNTDGQPHYKIEYLPLSPLNELFVHGKNPPFFWENIFHLFEHFLRDARDCYVQVDYDITAQAHKLSIDKTKARTASLGEILSIRSNSSLYYGETALPSLEEICDDCFDRVRKIPVTPCVLHGDLCLSNILLELRSSTIKVIDPRGLDAEGHQTIYGDQSYDYAKLTHSVIGLYDYIISGYYQLQSSENNRYEIFFDTDTRLKSIQKLFCEQHLLPNVQFKQIMPMVVLLFISMIPLHNDSSSRQKAFFANALRLYCDYVLGEK